MSLWQAKPAPNPNSTWTPSEDKQSSQEGRTSSPTPQPASQRIKYQGKRIGQVVKLKSECYDEYKACHAAVWPEVLKQIKECNIEDYSIFFDNNTRTLFASFKYMGYSFAEDMERMKENPKVREWWKMTDKMQESYNEGAVSSEDDEAPSWWKPLEEVFYNA